MIKNLGNTIPNNGDTPATAIEFRAPNDSGGEDIGQWRGLTKREAFAMAAMQGTLAGDVNNELTVKDIVEQAVYIADALLKELSNVQT